MTFFYKVAGHGFSLCLPDASPLCCRLGQYDPFRVDGICGPLFSVRLAALPELPPLALVTEGSNNPARPMVRVLRGGESWVFEFAPGPSSDVAGRLVADSAFRAGTLQLCGDGQDLFVLNNAMMLMYAFATAGLQTIQLHASAVVNGGRAFLWLAPSGTGKSTHSRLWMEHVAGTTLLNDDNPVVRILPGGRVEAYGTPWSGKTPCYRNEHWPVGAFVRLRRGSTNSISRMSMREAYAMLYSSGSGLKGEGGFGDGLHSTMEKLALNVPCFALECTAGKEAAMVCSQTLLGLHE